MNDRLEACGPNDALSELERKSRRILDCLEARLALQDQCFRGGDMAHIAHAAKVAAMAEFCAILKTV